MKRFWFVGLDEKIGLAGRRVGVVAETVKQAVEKAEKLAFLGLIGLILWLLP